MRKEKEKKEKEAKEAAKKKEKEEKKKQKEAEEAAKKKEKEEKKKAKKGDLSIAIANDDAPKEEEDPALFSPTAESKPEIIDLRNSQADAATDYKKRKNVFRLITESKAEYLFQASDEKDMKAWLYILSACGKVGVSWFLCSFSFYF